MKTKIVLCAIGALLLAYLSFLSSCAYQPPALTRVSKTKPVEATNVKIVEKVQKPGNPRSGSNKGVARGILSDPVSGERYAVVVGISDYPGTQWDLFGADDDAKEMATALTDLYGFTNVALLTDLGATREAVITAIDLVPSDAGELIFFFSGHGVWGYAEDGDNERADEGVVVHNGQYLLPIWDGELAVIFNRFTDIRTVFVFDSCRSGGMKKDLTSSNRVIVMACGEKAYAYEIGGGGELSTYFVEKGMLQGTANVHDYDGDGITGEPEQVTIEEAYDYARDKCRWDSPRIDDHDRQGDILP